MITVLISGFLGIVIGLELVQGLRSASHDSYARRQNCLSRNFVYASTSGKQEIGQTSKRDSAQ